ncbi:MAG: hypothetical protein IPL23_25675 [Saprospiraceae bacterium]|nr:hypothetical protein [Saprospiraceae bacterium]
MDSDYSCYVTIVNNTGPDAHLESQNIIHEVMSSSSEDYSSNVSIAFNYKVAIMARLDMVVWAIANITSSQVVINFGINLPTVVHINQ